jgi:hypothetical protein
VREKRRLSMEEWYLGKLLSLWPFELPLVAPLGLKVVCKCNWWCCHHFTTSCIVESFNNKHVSSVFFTNYSLPFCLCWTSLLWLFWNFFHFGLAKKVLEFKVSSPMFFLFICNFCNFRWWHHNHLVIPNIIASFISDLF